MKKLKVKKDRIKHELWNAFVNKKRYWEESEGIHSVLKKRMNFGLLFFFKKKIEITY
tara:strand:+ start:276 stop:446 length:171 start_codon:yes stop_codon:yes gene_type:complete